MKNLFNYQKPHLEAVSQFWNALIRSGDIAIDATCGNGHDTLQLSKLGARVIAIDIQEQALKQAKSLMIESEFPIRWIHASHASFPQDIEPNSVTLVTYNLGYLPGGDKSLITQETSTLESVKNALPLLKSGGAITLVCYRGHPGGDEEESAVLNYCKTLNRKAYYVSYTDWVNRPKHPTLIFIQKI